MSGIGEAVAHAYTPGLKVAAAWTVHRRRLLPITGEVLVHIGDAVHGRQVVARASMPGDVHLVNLANALSVPPADVRECVVKKVGDHIEAGEVLARTKGLFGLFKNEFRSKATGTIEAISDVTGQVIIRGPAMPVEVAAYLTGTVVEVLPNEGCIVQTQGSFVQGIFGVGGETLGRVRMACAAPGRPLDAEDIRPDMAGAVIVGGGRVTADAIRRAVGVGAVAIVAAGLDDQDLREILGYDLGVAITGSEELGISLVITEGFGDIDMAPRTFDLLAAHEGKEASVNGATQIRAGVLRPEVVIPAQSAAPNRASPTITAAEGVFIGAPVRAIRDPYFGRIGKVAALPTELQTLESGGRARVFEVVFESGERALVPRANVELLES